MLFYLCKDEQVLDFALFDPIILHLLNSNGSSTALKPGNFTRFTLETFLNSKKLIPRSPRRIGLTQSNLDEGHDFLMEV
jgi:hypothetical protein